MVLDKFSGGNPTEWIPRAEQYFTYLGFSENDWLPLASFYLDGDALDWFQWLHRNKQFFHWKHFTEKLTLRFRIDSNMTHTHINVALDLMRKLEEQLGNVERALCARSHSIVANPVLPDVDDKRDSDLPCDESAFIVEDPTDSDSDTVDECVQSWCDDQTQMQVLLPDFTSDLNDTTLKEVSGISTYKVFAEIPDRDIDMEVVDSVKNDVEKPETQVFDERFRTISTVKCDSLNLFKFDEILLALPCMLSACSSSDEECAYLSELERAKLPFSLYRFSPAQFELDFPFDPGSSLLITFLGCARSYSRLVVDEFEEIVKIFVCHIDSMTSDQCTLNQFPYDPDANSFIVTPGRCLQVHQFQPATSVLTLLLVDTFQLSDSVTYIRRTVEPAKSLVKTEPTISMWDPGISPEFMAVIASTDKVEAQTLFDGMYLHICLWITKIIEDHLDSFLMEYERGNPIKQLQSYDDKVEISAFNVSAKFLCKILELLVGNHLRAARRRNYWMVLSSPTYLVCNIFAKAQHNSPPNNDSAWSMTFHPYSNSSLGLVVSVSLANRPFDPGIHDIPLYFGADENLFPNSGFVSTSFLVVTLLDEQVCGLGRTYIGTDASEHCKLKKARQWKGLEHNPSVNLMSLFTITYRGGHLGTQYNRGNACIGVVERPYQGRHISHGYQTDMKKLFDVSIFFKTMSCKLDVSTGYVDCKQLEKGATLFRPKLTVTDASPDACDGFACICKACNKKEVFLLMDMAHNSLVASWVMCSPSKLVIVARSIQYHMLFFGNIAQFVMATIGRERASHFVLDSNLEGKVLFEDGSIVVNGIAIIRAYGLEVINEADPIKIVGPNKMLESFIWDPGPFINWLKRTKGLKEGLGKLLRKESNSSHLHS